MGAVVGDLSLVPLAPSVLFPAWEICSSLAKMSPVGTQLNSSMTLGTLTLVVSSMPVPAAGVGQMQEENKRVQGGIL